LLTKEQFQLLSLYLTQIAAISGFTMGEIAEVGNIEPIETYENTGTALKGLMTSKANQRH
jgi:hypothetical protein